MAGNGRQLLRGIPMPRYSLETIIVILLLLWLLGIFSLRLGGLVHLLLVIVLIVVIIRLLQGRRLM
jgi:hypothetical protein